jgi:group II intron reverse transcriptase/maturase
MGLFPIAKQKVHSLTGRINLRLMRRAFKSVKRNRGKAGIDKVSIKMFEDNLGENLGALMRQLKDGSYRPHPLLRRYIDKEPGKKRPLGIPAVRDRVAQEVVRQLLNPIFERLFHNSSYGFRMRRNCHMALKAALKFHDAGYKFVLDADIKAFFDELAHRVILEAAAAQVADGNILNLLEKFLRAGVMEEGVFKPTTVGTPQGGVISPLLANMVLNYLDRRLQERGFRFVRYADDFVVLARTLSEAEEALSLVTDALAQLGLKLSPEKTRITTFGKGYSFLGFVLSSRSRRMRPKSQRKFEERVKEITRRSANLDAEVIKKLNQVIRGSALYFATPWSTNRWIMRDLDAFVRRRVRCMKYKRFSYHDNRRMRCKQFERLGLLSLVNFMPARDKPSGSSMTKNSGWTPRGGKLCPTRKTRRGIRRSLGVARSTKDTRR